MNESLDDRLLNIISGMPGETGDNARLHLTSIRETWRGGNFYPDAAEALEIIAEHAAALRELLTREPAGE